MYRPKAFAEHDRDALLGLLRAHPLATVIRSADGGLAADHLPLLHDPEPPPYGTLHGHVARANPLWHQAGTGDVLAVFHGPQGYVSPGWYAEKGRSGAVVPTWNYAVVHAHGTLQAIDDPAWLAGFLERLTACHEAERPAPWRPADAPADYLARQLRAVVGIAIAIDRLVGKSKLSQNRPADDRAGVVRGLRAARNPSLAGMVDHKLLDEKRNRDKKRAVIPFTNPTE